MQPQIKLYTLSTCIHCKNTKKFLNDCKVNYTFVDVDLLAGQERDAVINEIEKLTPQISFPVVVIDNKVIVGFNKDEIKKTLGIS